MNRESASSSPSRATMWVPACIMLALLLYVGTWPVIEMKTMQVTTVTFKDYTGGNIHTHHITTLTRGPWTGLLYRPLHLLRESNGGRNVLADYWAWWGKVLNHSVAPTHPGPP
jgi:hypothetical protein